MSREYVYRLDQGDVRVERHGPRLCGECQERPSEAIVVVELRSAGMTHQIGEGLCVRCAEDLAQRIRRGLPAAREHRASCSNESTCACPTAPLPGPMHSIDCDLGEDCTCGAAGDGPRPL